jgi:hypothetical protein
LPQQFSSDKIFSKVSISGEGLGGCSVMVAYPRDNLVVVIAANARGGNLQPYASEIADIVRLVRD